MKMENCEQFNVPRVTIDTKGHEKERQEREKEKQMEMFRHEICLIQEEISKEKNRTGKNREGMNGCFLRGQEILEVDPEDLTKEDMIIHKELKAFKAGKIKIDEFEKKLNDRRNSVNKKTNGKIKNNQPLSPSETSIIKFLGWAGNRAVCESVNRKYSHKIKNCE